jgi:hypothetical protein
MSKLIVPTPGPSSVSNQFNDSNVIVSCTSFLLLYTALHRFLRLVTVMVGTFRVEQGLQFYRPWYNDRWINSLSLAACSIRSAKRFQSYWR